MTASPIKRRAAEATDFLVAAGTYWLSVYPLIYDETRHWRRLANRIPDPTLRSLALQAQQAKRGNIEGSAAFAAFVARRYRPVVVRAQVAFQSIYDYADTLAEQPSREPLQNARQLHQALLVALDPQTPHADYYAHNARRHDAGYLRALVDACRLSIEALPSHTTIRASARRLTEHIVAYQSFNLSEPQGGHRHLERWALAATPPQTDLRWWETAASAGSSLGLFALLADAANHELTPTAANAVEHAYWPWVGALHSLLDSLVDEPEDIAASQHSLLHYYNDRQEAAARLQLLTERALAAIAGIPDAPRHRLVLTAMASHYLSATAAPTQTVGHGVLESLGAARRPTMLIMRTRRIASNVPRATRRRY